MRWGVHRALIRVRFSTVPVSNRNSSWRTFPSALDASSRATLRRYPRSGRMQCRLSGRRTSVIRNADLKCTSMAPGCSLAPMDASAGRRTRPATNQERISRMSIQTDHIREWAGIVKCISVLTLIILGIGLMVNAVKLSDVLKHLGAILCMTILLLLLPVFMMSAWSSLSFLQCLEIVSLGMMVGLSLRALRQAGKKR